MRRTPFIALALFVVVAQAVSGARASSASAYKTYSTSHRFFQEQAAGPGGVSIILNVEYAQRSPKGKSTPRKVFVQFAAPVSCQVGGTTTATVASGPFKFQHQKVEFSGSFTNQFPPASNPAPGSNGTYFATGHLIRKKNKKKWRMEGTTTVLTHSSPPAFLNCTSDEIPYSATRCSWFPPANGVPPLCTNLPVGGSARD